MKFKGWERLFLVAGMAAGLSGCDLTKEGAVEKGKEMVASSLKDPDSAKFQNVYMVEDSAIGDRHYGVLCGEVNSRNSFGGFTGFRRFVTNFNYSKQGSLEVSYVTLEEGDQANLHSSGVSYFHEIYWLGKCEPRPTPVKEDPVKADLPVPAPAKPEVNKDAKPVKIVKASPATHARESRWAVQVASMSDAAQAANLQEKIAADGFVSYVSTKDGKSRIFVGPFADRSKAESLIGELRTKQLLKGFVIRVEQ